MKPILIALCVVLLAAVAMAQAPAPCTPAAPRPCTPATVAVPAAPAIVSVPAMAVVQQPRGVTKAKQVERTRGRLRGRRAAMPMMGMPMQQQGNCPGRF